MKSSILFLNTLGVHSVNSGNLVEEQCLLLSPVASAQARRQPPAL